MTFNTNAGLSYTKREADKAHNVAIIQQAIDRCRREGGSDLTVQAASAPVVATSLELGQGADEIRHVNYLKPIALVEDPYWPDGTGIRKERNTAQWEAIMAGEFCFKCGHRRLIPGTCKACGFTQQQFEWAIDQLWERKFLQWQSPVKKRA